MKAKTAIIVNDRNEGFIGWRSHCEISASGFETYRSRPHFAKRERVKAGSNPNFYGYPPTDQWVNEPVVFADTRSAVRAMTRIARHSLARVAVVALILLGCGGTDLASFSATPGAQGGVGPLPTAGALSSGGDQSEAGAAPAAGGASFGCSARGGCGTPAGASGDSGNAGSVMDQGGAPAAGTGGTSSGTAGAAGGSTVDPCELKSWDNACAGRICGKVPDGCGAEYGCGSCTGLTECIDGACMVTCATAELECGTYPGLSCGECDEGQDCGVVAVGKCSTCQQAPDPGGVCNVARPRLMKPCGDLSKQDCRRPFNQDPTWWCCP